MTMKEKKERLSAKIKRLQDASTIAVITNGDKTAEITMEKISSVSKTVVLHTGTSKAVVALFAVNAALRIIDEIESMNVYFGFIKTRKSFVDSLFEAMITADIELKGNGYNVYSNDNTYTLIAIADLLSYRDKINARKWLLMDVIADIQQTEFIGFSKIGNYYVPNEQIFGAGINKSCIMSNNGISIEVELNPAQVITQEQFTLSIASFYDAIKFNVADMVLDLN